MPDSHIYNTEHLRRFEALRTAAEAPRVHPRKPVAVEARDLRLLVALAQPNVERIAAALPAASRQADGDQVDLDPFGDRADHYEPPRLPVDDE